MARRLSLVTVLVDDYDPALDFYVGVLGMELQEGRRLDAGKRWVVVAPFGGSGTALLLARAVGERQEAAIGDQAGGRVFLFLETEDFWRDFEEFTTRGVIFQESPRREDYGTVAVFSDPFGNRWDLVQPGPFGSEHAPS